MIVKGTVTKKEDVNVDISSKALIDLVLEKVAKEYPCYRDIGYIKDGYIWTYSYTGGHNNDEVYEKTRQATTADLELINFVERLKDLFKND
jgi:hypothetical protein